MRNVKRINLALQGGGAHGAFTWGVLDRLLQEPGIEISAMTCTSAGSLNGAAVKAGLAMKGGSRETARENLDRLWQKIGAVNSPFLEPWLQMFPPAAITMALEYSVPYAISDTFGRMISPYDTGPFYQNPLTRIVEDFNFEDVCAHHGPQFHVCATNVRTGKVRVFTGDEIDVDPILASACLPTLFRAVEIPERDPNGGEPTMEAYWDGGFTGNPALFPLFQPNLPDDIVVVNINPIVRDELPRTAREIQNRINEISFNSSLLRELRAIKYVKDLIRDGKLTQDTKKDILIHMISDDELMTQLSVATKTVPNPSIFAQLKDAGIAAADLFVERDLPRVGKEGTVDLDAMIN